MSWARAAACISHYYGDYSCSLPLALILVLTLSYARGVAFVRWDSLEIKSRIIQIMKINESESVDIGGGPHLKMRKTPFPIIILSGAPSPRPNIL